MGSICTSVNLTWKHVKLGSAKDPFNFDKNGFGFFFAYFYAWTWWTIQRSGNFYIHFLFNNSDLGLASKKGFF